MKITEARRGKLITPSKFSNYDHCLNPYIGCQIGCSFCYVRFFVKDPSEEWGNFVRTRNHIEDKLPKEMESILPGTRIVIGTMMDPWMPLENKYKLTRRTLEILNDSRNDSLEKVGAFTRSPLVLNDVELIKSLPNGRVHYTVSMTPDEITRKLEPIFFSRKVRLDAIRKLKEAGVRVHVNLAPVIPGFCENIDEIAQELADIEPAEIFIDPLQPYGPSFVALDESMKDIPEWEDARKTIVDKKAFSDWKVEYHERWAEAWKPHKNLPILPLMCDHATHRRTDLRNGNNLDWDKYNDEA